MRRNFKRRTFNFKTKSRAFSSLSESEMRLFYKKFHEELYKAVEKQFDNLVVVKPLRGKYISHVSEAGWNTLKLTNKEVEKTFEV